MALSYALAMISSASAWVFAESQAESSAPGGDYTIQEMFNLVHKPPPFKLTAAAG